MIYILQKYVDYFSLDLVPIALGTTAKTYLSQIDVTSHQSEIFIASYLMLQIRATNGTAIDKLI